MSRRRGLLLLLLGTAALAGCGRQGDLRPPDQPRPPSPTDDAAGEEPGT